MMPVDLSPAVGMMFFIESETDDIELPGARLKAAREARGETIEAAASRCLLSAAVIHGLEANDYSALSGLSFVRGYLQIYARKLGLPETDILGPFDAWRGTTPPAEQPLHQFSELDLQQSKSTRWVFPVLSGLVIAVLLGLGVMLLAPRIGPWLQAVDLSRLMQALPFATDSVDTPDVGTSLQRPASAPESTPPNLTSIEAADSPVDPSVVPSSAPQTRLETPAPANAPSPEKTGVARAVEAPASASGSAVARQADPVAPSQPATEVSRAPSVASEPGSAMAESLRSLPTRNTPESPGNGFLQLRFSEQSWVEIRNRQGGLIMADLMMPGVDFNLEVTEVVEVLIGAVHATEMRFNGERLDLSGRAYQNVARITLGETTP
jgi:cytoskeleton protein RodZ